jgi:hypothetical protein
MYSGTKAPRHKGVKVSRDKPPQLTQWYGGSQANQRGDYPCSNSLFYSYRLQPLILVSLSLLFLVFDFSFFSCPGCNAQCHTF